MDPLSGPEQIQEEEEEEEEEEELEEELAEDQQNGPKPTEQEVEAAVTV